MTITFLEQTYDCARAVRESDKATLYLADGGTVEVRGVSNWDAFTLSGGQWSDPDVTPEEQLRADVDYIAIMTGVSL